MLEVLAHEGAPVICHAGVVPPKATWTGGFRAIGRALAQVRMVRHEVQSFETAGTFAVETEGVAASWADDRAEVYGYSLAVVAGMPASSFGFLVLLTKW